MQLFLILHNYFNDMVNIDGKTHIPRDTLLTKRESM